MVPVVGVGFLGPGNEVGRVLVILHEPAAPEVGDAFLIARAANDAQGVQVNRTLDGIGSLRGLAFDEDRVPLQQQVLQQIILILFQLNEMLCQHLTRRGAHIVQVRIPQFQDRLPPEPAVADQQTVNDARFVLFPTGGFGRRDDLPGDDGRVGFGDLELFELAGDDLLDLILETERDFCNGVGGDGGGDHVVSIGGEDWGLTLALEHIHLSLGKDICRLTMAHLLP